jgi:hypothetical protein
MSQQTGASGVFRPVGTEDLATGVLARRGCSISSRFEATATIWACLAAWRASGYSKWKTEALHVFSWFLGHNDLSLPLIDLETGSCHDGLHPDRVNENRGAESVVSYLLSLAEIRQVHRLGDIRAKFLPRSTPSLAKIDQDQGGICHKFSS